MISTNYYIISGISILLLCANFIHLTELDLISKTAAKRLMALIGFVIFEIVIDTLSKSLEGNITIEPTILYILNAIKFATNPMLAFLMFNLFNNTKSFHSDNNAIKWFKILLQLIIIVNAVLQVISLHGKFMFVIDENNIYQRTNFTFIYVGFLVSSIILMLCSMSVFSHTVQNANSRTLYGIFAILISGLALRFVSTNTNFDWLCVSISVLLINIYYVTLSLRLDALTKLLNRQVYNTLIEKINFSTVIFLIDANHFKKINDTYGHDCGDKTLKTIARCIFEACGEYGWCFRIGGDEFCVILKPQAFKMLIEKTPKNDIYIMCENLMIKLDEVIQKHSSKNNNVCLQYGVSHGYGIYYYPPEYPSIKDNMPLDKVIQLADKRMYLNKQSSKENHPIQEEQNVDMRASVVYCSAEPKLVKK